MGHQQNMIYLWRRWITSRPMTDQQKGAIAEVRSLYDSKIAEQDILQQSALNRLLGADPTELDAADARGESPIAGPSPGVVSPMPWGPTLAAGAWLPYLYWGLIACRGDFSEVSLHPWIELSGLGVLLILLSIQNRN